MISAQRSEQARSRSGPDLAEVAGRFGHVLHAAGIAVTPERSSRFATILDLATPATLDELYWTARVTLLSDLGQIATFDRVFAQVFGGKVAVADPPPDASGPAPPQRSRPGDRRPHPGGNAPRRTASSQPARAPEPGTGDAGADAPETVLAAVSEQERLRQQDFAALTPEELQRLRHLFAQLKVAPPPRRSRRSVRHPHGVDLDLRATLGRAHRTAGDALTRIHRKPRVRPRRLVLLCDISGSMESYARAYLQLLHSAVGGAQAEAFVFATRLTRVTRALRTRDPDIALQQAGQAAPDWSGGTRIGMAVKRFLDQHGRRGMARGAVVVIVSDGWERDDPELLGEQVAMLQRLAYRVVWVNPRSANPRYEPLVRGMAAALPHVDSFVSGHSLAALDEVLDAIGQE